MATAALVSILLLLVAHQLAEVLSDDEYPTITLPQGTLKGRKFTPGNLSPYYSFLGIPYAKPPVGNLRFKAPVPAEPWNGTLEALQEGNVCKQIGTTGTASLVGDEDCLFLNVYTPELPGSGSLRPVMVWIHGGGFLFGSGNKDGQGPEFLLNEGVVYVSINYRLGIFGFLSTEDEAAPGNAGLKDQVLALRWVQQNIAAFGGDPNQVTIFGQSAGGTFVQYHLLSPMSKGLFRSAIAHSGATSCAWAVDRKPRENAFLIGDALGFTGESSQDLVNFLRNVSSDQLLSTSFVTINEEMGMDPRWCNQADKTFNNCLVFLIHDISDYPCLHYCGPESNYSKDKPRITSMFHVRPSVEPVVAGEAAFITQDPLILMDEGNFHKVPFLTGVTLSEGLFQYTVAVLISHRTWQEIDQDFPKVFKPELRICRDESCGDAMIPKIKSFYFGDQHLNNNNVQNFVDLCTDMTFADGVLHGVKTMSSLSSAPVYFYQFSYDGGLVSPLPELANLSRPTHGDDMGYIFDNGIQVSEESLDAKVRSRMVTMWTNFVKTGNPTPEVTEEIPAWLPYTDKETNYLDIGAQLELKKDYHKRRMDFWDDLYSLK